MYTHSFVRTKFVLRLTGLYGIGYDTHTSSSCLLCRPPLLERINTFAEKERVPVSTPPLCSPFVLTCHDERISQST